MLEIELVTSCFPHSLHPAVTFYTGVTNQPNAANQYLCVFCKGSHSSTHCEVIIDKQAYKEFMIHRIFASAAWPWGDIKAMFANQNINAISIMETTTLVCELIVVKTKQHNRWHFAHSRSAHSRW